MLHDFRLHSLLFIWSDVIYHTGLSKTLQQHSFILKVLAVLYLCRPVTLSPEAARLKHNYPDLCPKNQTLLNSHWLICTENLANSLGMSFSPYSRCPCAKTTETVPHQEPAIKQSCIFTREEAAWKLVTCSTYCLRCPRILWSIRTMRAFESQSLSLLTLLLIPLSAFTPALEAMNSWSQEEACHDGHHRHWDARENDDEQVC